MALYKYMYLLTYFRLYSVTHQVAPLYLIFGKIAMCQKSQFSQLSVLRMWVINKLVLFLAHHVDVTTN